MSLDRRKLLVRKEIDKTSVNQANRDDRGDHKLVLQHVHKVFHHGRSSLSVLDDIHITVNTGAFVTLIGPSGCGKSTLFNIVAGLDTPSAGEIILDGDVNGVRAGKVGYMPQAPSLLPWRTVEENVLLGLDVLRRPRVQARKQAQTMLKQFGLNEFAQHYPATLSGGMRQRVALLRTILFNQTLLLLDEPFGALDALTRLSLQMWLLDVWQQFHASVLFITHDVREAILLSDRIYVLSARPATVLRMVEVDLPRPRQRDYLAYPASVALEQELLDLLMKEQRI